MKILFVSRSLDGREEGGIKVARRNLGLLEMIAGQESVSRLEIPGPSMVRRMKNFLLGESYGANAQTGSIMARISSGDYDLAFFDSSLYGGYVRRVAAKGIPTAVFYHNVESRYYSEKARVTHSLQDRMIIPYIRRNEKLSTLYASGRIALNERDARELGALYGKPADMILPTSFAPLEGLEELYRSAGEKTAPYCLFVGSDFFSNLEGAEWFIENVLPRINIPLKIVGSVCKSLEGKYPQDRYPNLDLAGFVDDIDMEYAGASFVVLPIFSGSGMKTKAVEALRYGKTIFGTDEGLEGVWEEGKGIGEVCNGAEDFISAINGYDLSERFNADSLEFFNEKFSEENAFLRLKNYIVDLAETK